MKLSHTITCAFAVAFACSCLPVAAADDEASGQAQSAAMDPDLKEELDFVKALVENGLSSLATPVIESAKKRWPDAAAKLKVYEMQSFLMSRQYGVVLKEIEALKGQKGKESEYWALRLSLADAYYFYEKDKLSESKKIYDEFFKTITKPSADLLDFFVESGFRWAQICTREKMNDEAVAVYKKLLAAISNKDPRWCNVALAAEELILRLADEIPADPKDKQAAKRAAYINQATAWVDKLLWKRNLPLVFGKAIAMKAHIEMLRGKPGAAQDLVNNYMPDLNEIHEALTKADPDGSQGYVRASPMPECRYLLAKMLWNAVKAEVKKPKPNEDLIKDALFGARDKSRKRNGFGAYNHALNVYVRYTDSVWAADAADLAEEIEALVKERYKRDIHPKNIPPRLAEKARTMRFQKAYDLFREGDYEKAIAAYETILANAPDSKDTVNARGVVAECYIKLRGNAKDGSPERAQYEKSAREAEDFLATQYKGKEESLVRAAGNQTLRLAALEHDAGMRTREQELYDAYFANYPDHVNAAQTAYRLANGAYKNEEWTKSIKYFERFVEQDPNSSNIAGAYYLLSVCNEKLGNADKQEEWLRQYIKAEKKVGARTQVQLKLADMQQRRGFAAFDAADAMTDAAAADAMRREAYKGIAGAIRDFRAVGVALTNELALAGKSLDAKDRAQYELQSEQAFFLEAVCWQRMAWPESKISVFRAQAVKAFENYLRVFPTGKYASQALVRIGTVYTAEKNMAKAQEALTRLQREFPESDEAKNSVPRLAKSLIEMGMKREGAIMYKKMLEAENGKYTAGQFLQAGDALLEAQIWQDAGDAYAKAAELASSLTNAAAYLPPTLIGQARAAKGAKNWPEARQKLDEFIEKYSKYSLATNAYDMLVDVALEMGRSEREDSLRTHAFSAAFGALKKLRPYRETPMTLCATGVLAQVEAKYQTGDVDGKKADELWTTHAQMRKLQNELDDLEIRRLNVFLARLKADEQSSSDTVAKTRRDVIGALTSFLAAHDPFEFGEDEKKVFVKKGVKVPVDGKEVVRRFVSFGSPVAAGDREKFVTKEEFANLSQKDRENLLSPEQCRNLERCYGELLPLMVQQGMDKQDIEQYFDRYMELFGENGEHAENIKEIRSKVKGN